MIGRRVAAFCLRMTLKYPQAGVNCVNRMPNTQASRAILPRLSCKKICMYMKRHLSLSSKLLLCFKCMFMKGSCPSLGFALPFCVDCDVIDTAAKRVRMLETRAKI